MDVDDAATIRQVDDELREGGQGLLEEDRDVLGRQVLDGDAVAVGAIGDGGVPVPVRKNSTIPPQSSEATVAWMNWPPRYSGRVFVEEDRRRCRRR